MPLGMEVGLSPGHNRWAENWGLYAPLGEDDLGPPSNTVCPGTRPTGEPSFILIRPTVWPQYTNVTDKTGETDRQTDRQLSDSVGRTVLQTVAQKRLHDLCSCYNVR